MILALCLLGCLTLVGLAMLFHASFTAPKGVEDARGFHYTEPVAPQQPVVTAEMLTASDLSFFTH